MAGMPPGVPGAGGPQMPPAAPSMPPPGPMPGGPPMGAPMQGGPRPPGMMGGGMPGPASPLGFAFTDLSGELPNGWQILDIATRLMKTALRTTDFQRMPKVAATISSQIATLTRLISHYTSAGDGGSGMPTGAPSNDDDEGAESPDTTLTEPDDVPEMS